MGDLLTAVLDAHGGLNRWAQADGLIAQLSLGGPFWASVGWPNVWTNQTVTLATQHEHITFTPFTGSGIMSVFDADPEYLQVRAGDGQLLDSRKEPRKSFPAYGPGVTWDAIQVAYFTSCATWNYLTAPFSFASPDVVAREIEPWDEEGEVWRRLAVTFPPRMPNHNPEQIFYYDDHCMQRRMDYQPEVTGSLIAHYCYDQAVFDGLVFPRHREVQLRDENGVGNHSFTPITVDVEHVAVT